MSRNIRRKTLATTPSKARKRRGSISSSSIDLSDEDGYSAVEDISDSEDDDEEDVNAVEEESILLEGLAQSSDPPRPLSDDEDEAEEAEEAEEADGEDEDEEEEDDDDQDVDDVEDFDEDNQPGGVDIDDNASWGGILSDREGSQLSDYYKEHTVFSSEAVVERHVRFDVPDSDSDSTETEDDHADLFPDIFVSQNSLDPAFRREIEHDPDDSSGSNSFWDYHGQYEEDSDSDAEEVIRRLPEQNPLATPLISQAINAVAEVTPAFEEPLELDGYETDGDTTDEEDVPEPVIRKRARRPSNTMSEVSDSDAESPVKPERGQPRVGKFKLDRSDKKPIAVLNPLTRKMMIFTPHRRRQLDLSPEQFNFPWVMEDQTSPILSNSANMMLSAMFSSNTFGDFVNAQAIGPTEAFFPFTADPDAVEESSSIPSGEEDDDDEEKLNIEDFITWKEDEPASSGDEGQDEWENSATPRRPSTSAGDMDVLSHLTADTVGAFRRNQINQQLILSNQATQDSLAFSGPYNYTTIRGLRSDRFDTAGVPLTPIRRHKRQMSDVTRSPLEAISSKRKASAEAGNGHKRQRSISDVNLLRL